MKPLLIILALFVICVVGTVKDRQNVLAFRNPSGSYAGIWLHDGKMELRGDWSKVSCEHHYEICVEQPECAERKPQCYDL